jgi:hypothetical protein
MTRPLIQWTSTLSPQVCYSAEQIDAFAALPVPVPRSMPALTSLKEPLLTKRLLLAAGILSTLAGCGGAVGAAVPTAPNGTARVVDTASTKAVAPSPPTVGSTPAPTATPALGVVAPAAPVALAAPAATVRGGPTSPPVATPRPQHNLLTGPHGLNTMVGGDYTDCSGTTEVAHDTAVIDTCHTTAVLFIGHNRGVFTPLLSYVVGDVITWYDQAGRLHHLRIVAVRDVSSSVFPPVIGPYEFQTCLYTTANSSLDRDLDAVDV